MSAELWTAVLNTSQQLEESPRIRELAATIQEAHGSAAPVNQGGGPAWQQSLSSLVGRGNWRYHEQVFRFAELAPMDPLFDSVVENPDGRELMERIRQVAHAGVLTFEWLRARLPGYPNVLAPQSAVEPMEVSLFSYPWVRSLRQMRLHMGNPPNRISESLEIPSAGIAQALQRLSSQLERSPEFVRLRGARDQLTPESRAQLTDLRRRAKHDTSNEVVDAIEPRLAMRRFAIRSAAVQRICKEATGPAALYIESFQSAEALLDDVWGALSYLAAWRSPIGIGEPIRLTQALYPSQRLDLLTVDPRAMFLWPRALVIVPRVTDHGSMALTITRITMSFSGPSSFGGHELDGAGEVFEGLADLNGVPWLA